MVEAEQQAKQEVQQLQVINISWLEKWDKIIRKFFINLLQERLSRCAKQCEDQARDSLPPIGTPSLDQEMKAKKSMENCLIKCCDTHEKLIPKLASRLRGSLGNC